MENAKLKSSISRIMSDLIKLDNLITASELEFLDRVHNKYGVTDQDRKMGFYMSLSEAVGVISQQPASFRRDFFEMMVAGSKADGQCSRPEALLLMAVKAACGLGNSGRGTVYSFVSKGVPLHRDQLIYISREDRFDRSPLSDDETYEDINNIARLSGFELVYVPRIAKHFDTYEETDILRKVLRLVRPTLDRSEDELIRQLRAMTPYKFYTGILERRMRLSLDFDSPCWLVKLGGSQVAGVEYSNFLLLKIDLAGMKRQVKDFMSEFLLMQPEHMVTVSYVEEDADNFRYGGFIKSILDIICLDTEDRWDVVVRLRGCKEFQDGDGKVRKAAISIRRGEEEWPLIGPDRDASFYALILCATAESPGGVELRKDLEAGCRTYVQYEGIYRQMSGKGGMADCPNICFSETRRPILTRLNYAIEPVSKTGKKPNYTLQSGSNYLTERDLYKVAKSQHKYYVVLNSSNVLVRSKEGMRVVERRLKESALYRTFVQVQ